MPRLSDERKTGECERCHRIRALSPFFEAMICDECADELDLDLGRATEEPSHE